MLKCENAPIITENDTSSLIIKKYVVLAEVPGVARDQK